jgi:hypothetical protein
MFLKVKGSDMSKAGQEDRRLLFVAIARGVLKYLKDHETAIQVNLSQPAVAHNHKVGLDVTMESHN